jgi:hypothetical protein
MQKTGDYGGGFEVMMVAFLNAYPSINFPKQFSIYLSIEEIQESEIESGHCS